LSDEDKHSKTEQPTAKKLEKAREKGSPPTSILMTSTVTLLAGMICLYVFGSFMMNNISKQTVEILGTVGSFELTERNVYLLVLRVFLLLLLVLAPIIITVIVTSIASNAVQDGGRMEFRWERISFDLTKLNPLTGFGRMFNKKALVEMVKSFLKLLVIGFIAYRVLRDEVHDAVLLRFQRRTSFPTSITVTGPSATSSVKAQSAGGRGPTSNTAWAAGM